MRSFYFGDWQPTTGQASKFEYEDGGEKGPFQRKVFVRFPPGRLKGGKGHEKGGGIPANLVKAMKLVGDTRNSGGYNSLLRASDGPIEEKLQR